MDLVGRDGIRTASNCKRLLKRLCKNRFLLDLNHNVAVDRAADFLGVGGCYDRDTK